MIGIGVFTSLGFQVAEIPSGFAIMALWIAGGLCAFCGAISYGEIASALPRSGGEYHFLSRIYHPAAGFLAGWISATVGFAAPIALAAIAFRDYGGHALFGSAPMPRALYYGLPLGVVWICTAVHLAGGKRRGVFQNLFAVLKVGLIVAFVVACFSSGTAQAISFAPKAGDGRLIFGRAFATSLIYVMYAYSGWNASTYIVGEIRDPRRNVARSVALGTAIVAALYVAVNAAFLIAAPMSEMASKANVASVAAAHAFGERGGRAMDALICIGLISTVSSMVWIGPRVTAAMGEDFRVLRVFGRLSAAGVPQTALLAQLGIATVLILTSTFEAIMNGIQLVLTLCSMATVAGVFVLRARQPDLPRAYRTWGYPVTPFLFLAVSGWMLYYVALTKPWESICGVALLVIGLAAYAVSSRLEKKT